MGSPRAVLAGSLEAKQLDRFRQQWPELATATLRQTHAILRNRLREDVSSHQAQLAYRYYRDHPSDRVLPEPFGRPLRPRAALLVGCYPGFVMHLLSTERIDKQTRERCRGHIGFAPGALYRALDEIRAYATKRKAEGASTFKAVTELNEWARLHAYDRDPLDPDLAQTMIELNSEYPFTDPERPPA